MFSWYCDISRANGTGELVMEVDVPQNIFLCEKEQVRFYS